MGIKEFSFVFILLSYNIRGLPRIVARDQPSERITRIAPLLNDYPIVLLQEDFAYHEIIQKVTRHRLTLRGNDSRFHFLRSLIKLFCGSCGSGLTTLLDFDKRALKAYGTLSFGTICSGWLGKERDCWVTKGALFATLEFSGLTLTIYNLHLDAGESIEDQQVRERQLELVKNHIEKVVKPDDALIIGGDFNMSRKALRSFTKSLKLLSAIDTPDENTEFQPIDHIFYRNGKTTSLMVIESGIMPFPRLSDHDPRYVRFGI